MTTIQILGVSGAVRMSALRANVIQALEEMGTKAIVETISDVDMFIQYKINGIPALVVNGTVVLQKEVPSVEDLKILLKVFDQSSSNHFEMKKILVPTDFSEVSKGAYLLALELAKIQNGGVKIIHVYHPEYDPQNPYLTEPLNLIQEVAEEKLTKFAAHAGRSLPAPAYIEKELLIGFPVEEIIKCSEEPDADLIVMGTTGDKGLLEKLFGTVSTNVAQKADCPVLLVPKDYNYKGFKHILYASDFQSTGEDTLNRLVDFANLFKADIHFVHVTEDGSSMDYKEVENQLFKILFHGGEPTFSFTMSKVEGTSVTEGLNDYAIRHKIDLVVLVSPHRTFWESLFHKSVTKAMVLNTQLPIMVLRK